MTFFMFLVSGILSTPIVDEKSEADGAKARRSHAKLQGIILGSLITNVRSSTLARGWRFAKPEG